MRRFYARLVRFVRKAIRRNSAYSPVEEGLIARIPVVGARFEENGWSIEVRRDAAGIYVAICGTYGERVAGGLLSSSWVTNARSATLFPIDCGDIVLGLSEAEWAAEIRTLSGQLIGHVARMRLTESLLTTAERHRVVEASV